MLSLYNYSNDLETQGYVVLKKVPTKKIFEALSFFNSNKENKLFTTHASSNLQHKFRVHEFLLFFFNDLVFDNYEPIWGNFMYKEPHGSNLELHADWTYVNEEKNKSYNVWCPLVDTNLKNGCIWVVPKSHKIVKDIRGVALPRFYENHENILKRYFAKPLKLKAGEVLVYDHRLIHFSYPNYTSKGRPAATMIFTPINIPHLLHYTMVNSEKINEYHFSSSEFLINLGFFERPSPMIKPVREIDKNLIRGYSLNEIESNLEKIGFLSRYRTNKALNKLKKFSEKNSTLV